MNSRAVTVPDTQRRETTRRGAPGAPVESVRDVLAASPRVLFLVSLSAVGGRS